MTVPLTSNANQLDIHTNVPKQYSQLHSEQTIRRMLRLSPS